MSENNITEVVDRIMTVLKPLPSEDRQRAVSAALTLMGEQPVKVMGAQGADDDTGLPDLPARAKRWAKQYNLTEENIAENFHIDGGNAEVITAELFGGSEREKVQSAYILTGLAALLTTDSAQFADDAARDLCKRHGCLNMKHHTEYIDDGKSLFVGSKKTGWTLTTIALKQGASMLSGATAKND